MNKTSKIQQRLANKGRVPVSRTAVFPPAKEVPFEDGKKYVTYMSRDTVTRYAFKEDDILISISNSDAQPPAFVTPPKEMLALHFNDYVDALERERGIKSFSPEIAEEIAQFLKRNTDARNIIVHCNYGESRSRAVALCIAETLEYEALTLSNTGNLTRHKQYHGRGNDRVYYSLFRAIADHFDI